MKIGIFTECYTPVMNGVVVSVLSFKEQMERSGHEVFVFAPEHPEAKHEKGVYRFPAITDRKKRLYPVLFPSIDYEKLFLPEKIVKELDIVHAQHMFTAGRLARYVARKYHKPLVYTYHTLIENYTGYFSFLSPLVSTYLRGMSRRFCNSCDQIITPSNPMKKILQNRYKITKPIEVIMTGIDPRHYQKRSADPLRKKFGISRDKKILLYLSRIAKEKNIDFLFEAFVKIRETYPKCHLVMVGGGPEEEWCHVRVKVLGVEDHVSFTGMVPKEEANEFFGMADIFTFPSITETQGIVIAEAMASGTPPVAVGKMGPVDLIHDGEDGFLTKLSVSDFAEKVLVLLRSDKKREEFAQAGILRVDEFSTKTQTKKLIELYESLLKQAES